MTSAPVPATETGLDPEEHRLHELGAVSWRRVIDEPWLRREGRRWTMWTVAIAVTFLVPGIALLIIEPFTFPVALMSFAHGWVIPELYARRGVNPIKPLPVRPGAPGEQAETTALGLLGDLVDHGTRDLARETGLARHPGRFGVWLVGEAGALLVRRDGRRVDCWCVRAAKPYELPRADRISHLLLALREDERGFATVANLSFSGAPWRVRRRMPKEMRPALDAAKAEARAMNDAA
ncbi:MAG: hypothetical protein ACR2NA_13435 [Solirubrobacterales bacterium]